VAEASVRHADPESECPIVTFDMKPWTSGGGYRATAYPTAGDPVECDISNGQMWQMMAVRDTVVDTVRECYHKNWYYGRGKNDASASV